MLLPAASSITAALYTIVKKGTKKTILICTFCLINMCSLLCCGFVVVVSTVLVGWHEALAHVLQGCFRCEWGSEVSCSGHHRQREKITTWSALDGTIFDFTQIPISTTQYEQIPTEFKVWWNYVDLLSFFQSITIWHIYGRIVFQLFKLLSFFWLTYCSMGLCFSVG